MKTARFLLAGAFVSYVSCVHCVSYVSYVSCVYYVAYVGAFLSNTTHATQRPCVLFDATVAGDARNVRNERS